MEGKFEPTAKRKQIIEAYTGAAYQVAISAIEQETGRKMVGLDVRIFTEQRPPTMLEVQEQYVRRFVTEQRPKGIGYAKFRSRSHRAVICVYDSAGNPA
jgi:hypothetical protein